MAVLFPMAPFMVSDWVAADEVGTWAGLLTSAYNVASIPAGVFWGRLSDRHGRRPCMAAVMLGSAVSIVFFGTSTTLARAVLARCVGGLFSGINGLVMAGLRDITTAEQRPTAVASVSWAYGVGLALGPMIGGALSRPAESMPALRGSLFDAFPYLLPCLIVGVLIVVCIIFLVWLPMAPADKLRIEAHSPAEAAITGESAVNTVGGDASPATDAPAGNDSKTVPPPQQPQEPPLEQMLEFPPEGDGGRLLADSASPRHTPRGWRAAALCLMQPVVLLLFAHLLLNFGIAGIMETFPLYLTRNDASGLGLRPVDVGEALLPQSAVIMVMPLAYPLVARCLGSRGAFLLGIAPLLVFCLVMPMLRWLKGAPTAMWAGLLVLAALRGTTGPLVFPSIALLVNGVITERYGLWNGLMTSIASVARASSPCLFGVLFSVGTALGHGRFPFDVSMPFLLAGSGLAASALLVAGVPLDSDEGPRGGATHRKWRHRLMPACLRSARAPTSSTGSSQGLVERSEP